MDLEQAYEQLVQFPHCDTRVLHAPSECEYCDLHPDWQALRLVWGVAFTGHPPRANKYPCPADRARGAGRAHVWGGNRPTRVEASEREIPASLALYGHVGPVRRLWRWIGG